MSVHASPIESIERALFRFDVASMELLDERALQRRVDSKYLFPVTALPELLDRLQDHYQIVHAQGRGLARYSSLYWDTAQLDAYHGHRRGRRPRFKVRIRHHDDRGRSYLEIKRKGNRDQTTKARRERAFRDDTLSPADRAFIAAHSGLRADALLPMAWTHFTRVTLVGVDVEERITLDCNLGFERGDQVIRLPTIAIAEIKQATYSHTSPVIQACRSLRLRPMSASKYCLAVARLSLDRRTHAFAEALRAIRRYE